jgi:hypothetical protein
MRGDLGGLRRKAFLIGLGLGGLLELLFHWLEGGSEHGGGQLGVRFIDIISMDGLGCGLDGQRFALPTTPTASAEELFN